MTDPPREVNAFYDGQCGLCHLAVSFLLKRDRDGALRFAPIQTQVYRRFARQHHIALTPRSIIVQDPKSGRLLAESAAVLYLLRHCRAPWPLVAAFGFLVPRTLRDRLYRWVAGTRHRWFKPPSSLYPKIPHNLTDRLLRD